MNEQWSARLTWIGVKLDPNSRNIIKVEKRFFSTFKMTNFSR